VGSEQINAIQKRGSDEVRPSSRHDWILMMVDGFSPMPLGLILRSAVIRHYSHAALSAGAADGMPAGFPPVMIRPGYCE
jgi:hypothetical protein